MLCPDCLAETRRGMSAERRSKLLERVMEGGPIYSFGEQQQICNDVREALEAEICPAEDPDDAFSPNDLNIAVGFPHSGGDE